MEFLRFANERKQPCVNSLSHSEEQYERILNSGCQAGNSTENLLKTYYGGIYYETKFIANEDCVALDGKLGMRNRKRNSPITQSGGTAFAVPPHYIIAPRLNCGKFFCF